MYARHFVKPLSDLRGILEFRGTLFKKHWYTLIPLFNHCYDRITMTHDPELPTQNSKSSFYIKIYL